MSHLIQNNFEAIRLCIIYESLGGIPPIDAWKSMCNKLGNDVISFPDFEFWYMRYLNQNFEEWNGSKELKRFEDLPIMIIENIVSIIDPMDKLMLRKVSRGLRRCVDCQDPGFKKIKMSFQDSKAIIELDNDKVTYSLDKDICQVENGTRKGSVDCSSLEELVSNDVVNVLTHPKLKLDFLRIENSVELDVVQKLTKFDGKIMVKNLCFDSKSSLEEEMILSKISMDHLETLNMKFSNQVSTDMRSRVTKIGELTRNVKHSWLKLRFFEDFPIEEFINRTILILVLNGVPSDSVPESLMSLLRKAFESTTLEQFEVILKIEETDIRNMLRGLGFQESDEYGNVYNYFDPNGNDIEAWFEEVKKHQSINFTFVRS